uniref:Reverse transcriptase domain-containing protein n=1 Tax=Cannabis sativa TaxID=3483 RepID=A0A803Q160_CANSA
MLFRMGSGKAPGPDGMSVIFYKHYWEFVGNEFCEVILDFFVTGRMHKGFNDRNLVLIPKTQNLKRTNHYRPISLCNVTYKVISKLIANKIKPILPRIICPMQAAFVLGRRIQDNNVIVQEIIHTLTVLECFEVLEKVCNWVEQCISTTSLNVCLNGSQVGKIKPSCGLRQGDPLSPYLYIWAANILSRLLNEALGKGVIKGIRLSRKGPFLSLRMTSSWSRLKDGDYNFILENLTAKLQGWKAKTLSKAGRANLIKSVGVSLPSYAMQTTQLSNRLMHKIDGMVRDFWWGFEKDNHEMHLKAWDKLCLPKSRGGLGFQKTKEMNLAFLTKWGWNLLTGNQSLCCRIFEAKYMKGKDFLSYKFNNSDSWFWKNVVKAKAILRKWACKLVGDGKDTRIWRIPGYLMDEISTLRAPHINVAPSLWNKMWNSNILERHKMMWWSILSKALSVRAIISKRFYIEDRPRGGFFQYLVLVFICGTGLSSSEGLENRALIQMKFSFMLRLWSTPFARRKMIRMCLAVVARNHMGFVLGVHSSRVEFSDAPCGEVVACCAALEFERKAGSLLLLREILQWLSTPSTIETFAGILRTTLNFV